MTRHDLATFLAQHKASIARRIAELDDALTAPRPKRPSYVCITKDAAMGLEAHNGGLRLGRIIPGQLHRFSASIAATAADFWNLHHAANDICAVTAVTEQVAYQRARETLALALEGLELAQDLIEVAETV